MVAAAVKHILIAEDERRISDIVRDYLERAGYRVTTASTGPDALAAARARRPDLIVLDLGLPELDGVEVAKAVRAHSTVPIIMLTARVDERDKLAGLELGADDYITKPFSPNELVARVRAVFRRVDTPPDRGDLIEVGGLVLDTRRLQVTVDGRGVDVTPTEFALLAALARQPGRVFTRAQLLDAIRGDAVEAFDRAIDAHVKNVRRKIEADPHHPRFLLTVHGVGYKFAG
jgi:two-component system, OmpR family, alkaline phosphatase synthesis response regulator PhoP